MPGNTFQIGLDLFRGSITYSPSVKETCSRGLWALQLGPRRVRSKRVLVTVTWNITCTSYKPQIRNNTTERTLCYLGTDSHTKCPQALVTSRKSGKKHVAKDVSGACMLYISSIWRSLWHFATSWYIPIRMPETLIV